jgi:hypothetical protein
MRLECWALPILTVALLACSRAFIKGIKSSVVDEQELREAWLGVAPDMELPPVLGPLYFEVSQVSRHHKQGSAKTNSGLVLAGRW